MIFGGDGDGDDTRLGPWARRLSGDAERLPSDAEIFCADGKKRNRFNVSTHALSYASTAVERDIIRIMRQHSDYAAALIPGAVMSVLHQHTHADLKGSARESTRVGGLLLAEKPLTIGGFA